MGKRAYEDDKVDKELENGPVDNRSCTDILCCIFFLVAIGLMYVLFTVAMIEGKPEYLPAVYDANKRPCGLTPDTKDYKYAYFTNPMADEGDESWYLSVLCLKKCPTNTTVVMECLETDATRGCKGFNPSVLDKDKYPTDFL